MARAVAALVAVVVGAQLFTLFAPATMPPMTADNLPPAPLYRPLLAVFAAIDAMLAYMTPPNMLIFRHIMSYMHTVEIYTAAKLGIADVLAGGAASTIDIAVAVTHQRCLGESSASASSCAACALRITRLMRALSALGVFREVSPGLWENSPMSECLRTDSPASLRASALNFGGVQYAMMEDLPTTVLTGEASFKRIHGLEFWDYYDANSQSHAIFDATMRELGALGGADAAIAADYDWNGGDAVGTVVDIGGGLGDMLATILASRPKLQGAVFDIPAVAERARARWSNPTSAPACHDRVSIIAGDMFEATTIPSRDTLSVYQEVGRQGHVADKAVSYALRDIIHDWPDGDVIRMLRALRAVMAKAAAPDNATHGSSGDDPASTSTPAPALDRVVLVTRLLYDNEGFIMSEGAADADVLMLGAFGTSAGERTLPHIRALLEAAGFAVRHVTRVRGRYSVVHAEPMEGHAVGAMEAVEGDERDPREAPQAAMDFPIVDEAAAAQGERESSDTEQLLVNWPLVDDQEGTSARMVEAVVGDTRGLRETSPPAAVDVVVHIDQRTGQLMKGPPPPVDEASASAGMVCDCCRLCPVHSVAESSTKLAKKGGKSKNKQRKATLAAESGSHAALQLGSGADAAAAPATTQGSSARDAKRRRRRSS